MTGRELREWIADHTQPRAPVEPGPWSLTQSQGIARAISGDVACSECNAPAPRATLDGTGRCEGCRT